MLSEITWKGRGRQNTYFRIWSKANEIGCKVLLSLFFLNLVPAGGPPSLPPAFIERREEKKFNFSSFKFSFILKSFVLSYISKIFRHQKYWHTNPIRIMNVADIISSRIQNKISVLFSEGNIFPFQYCVQSRILVFVGWNDVILIFLWSLFSKSIEIFRKYERSGKFV